jgi:NhaA family Na+:H+ antiporter
MRQKVTAVLQFVLDNSLLLAIGAAAGLIWANLDPATYQAASSRLTFTVNDIGMVFFFGVMTKEVYEATLPGGPLASWRQAAVPVFAAIGGMVAPAAFYLIACAMLGRSDLSRGWAIPCATDIAFAYLAVRMVFKRGHPALPFLLLLAIADDALGLVILAIFYPAGADAPMMLIGGVAAAVAFAALLRRFGVANFWPYVLGPGVVSWLALHEGGLHPALALVPIVPLMPHARATLEHFELWWRLPVQIVLLLFGVVNAGVSMASVGTLTCLITISLLAGKPAGIIGATALAERFGFRRSEGLDYRSLAILGIAAGIGFTVALFFATAAFPSGKLLDEAKMGALLSIAAFPLAVLAGRWMRRS